jgi:hypothetical protein
MSKRIKKKKRFIDECFEVVVFYTENSHKGQMMDGEMEILGCNLRNALS